jgi:hypothetical protein
MDLVLADDLDMSRFSQASPVSCACATEVSRRALWLPRKAIQCTVVETLGHKLLPVTVPWTRALRPFSVFWPSRMK